MDETEGLPQIVPPIFAVAPVEKFIPVIVTEVPPKTDPDDGEIELNEGPTALVNV